MTGEEKLNDFLEAVDNWITCKNIIPSKGPTKELHSEEYTGNVSRILSFTADMLQTLTAEECLSYAYELHTYGEYLESVKAKENIVLEWADASMWYIVSTLMQNYGTKYTKWQEKYYSAIKENPMANDLSKIRIHAASRVTMLNGKSERIQKMADILTNLSRRRQS